MNMNLPFPYRLGAQGTTQSASDSRHVRGMLEMLLLTGAGERVNRPDYGGGLNQLLFGPVSPELAATVQHTLRAEVIQWLDDVIDLRELAVIPDDNRIVVKVSYQRRDNGAIETAEFIQTA
jgi:phage baseplate assembly protein W